MTDYRRLIQDRRCWVVFAAVLLWFVVFPEDLNVIKSLFEITQSLSLGVYIFASTVLVCWTWQRRCS